MNWANEFLGLFGSKQRSFVERLADRFLEAVESAAGSVERTTERAGEAADEARRRTETRFREVSERARAGARARRDALAERVEAIGRRAAEIREERHRHREERRERRARRRVRTRRMSPMQLDVRRDDKIVLRGRRPVNLRTADGSTIRYRYYERPGFWLRFYLHLTGRQVWPRR